MSESLYKLQRDNEALCNALTKIKNELANRNQEDWLITVADKALGNK